MAEKPSAADMLSEKGPMADLARRGAEELGDPTSPHNLKKPWSTRIPAAIKKAEEKLGQNPYWISMDFTTVITAGEVALAKALWEADQYRSVPHEALIAFTEKIEKLT